MANMSYCRFENTSQDLSACVGAMRDMEKRDGKWGELHYEDEGGSYWEEKNEYEEPCVKRMAKLCEEFLEMYGDRC